MKKIFLSALVTISSLTATHAQETSFLSGCHCIYRISADNQTRKYLLLPIQENAELANIKVIADSKQLKTLNVRLASTSWR